MANEGIMVGEGKIGGASSRGADWEVVVLTDSTYAASPGPDTGPPDDSRDKEFHGEHDSSSEIFMYEHFVFPPYEHENLPIEPSCDEIHDKPVSHGILPAENEHDYLDEFNDYSLDVQLWEVQEGAIHSFFHTKTDSQEKAPPDVENYISDTYDCSNQNYGTPPDPAKFGKTNDGKNGESSLPCEAWWKRHAISLYNQAKETNTLWSIFMAATLMGLVVLGQQWQREKLQFQQLKWRFSITNERMSRILGSVNRFKDAFTGGHHHNSLIHGGAAAAAHL